MNIHQKLQYIYKKGRYTQEQLAREIGVSFVSVNSWLNKDVIPRKKYQKKIQEIYDNIFGKKFIGTDVLLDKKESTKKLKNIFLIRDLIKNKEICDEILVKLTYNTNSIEGSTVTEADTRAIIFNEEVFQNYSLREQLEVQNHKKAFFYTLRLLEKKEILTEDHILRLHHILMGGILENSGFFRNHPVRILGSGVPTANYLKIPDLIKSFLDHFYTKNNDDLLYFSESHAFFEKIHPFSDGNGRVGRLLLILQSLSRGLPPIIIDELRKNAYYKALQKAQISEKFELLSDLLFDSFYSKYLE